MKTATYTTNTATACAPPADMAWHQINWTKAHGNVRRLQARIVKATQTENGGQLVIRRN